MSPTCWGNQNNKHIKSHNLDGHLRRGGAGGSKGNWTTEKKKKPSGGVLGGATSVTNGGGEPFKELEKKVPNWRQPNAKG